MNPRKPRRLAILAGLPGHRKPPPDPPQPASIPGLPPPAWLHPYGREEWDRLAPELEQLGLLTIADLSVFAGFCQSVARVREAAEISAVKPTAAAVVRGERLALNQMRALAAEFGLTPASRARVAAVSLPDPAADKKRAEFFGAEPKTGVAKYRPADTTSKLSKYR